VIAIDQDALGRQGARAWAAGEQEIWTRPLADGSVAVAAFNRSAASAQVTVRWADIGVAAHGTVRDVWTHALVDARGAQHVAAVPAHGVAMWRVSR